MTTRTGLRYPDPFPETFVDLQYGQDVSDMPDAVQDLLDPLTRIYEGLELFMKKESVSIFALSWYLKYSPRELAILTLQHKGRFLVALNTFGVKIKDSGGDCKRLNLNFREIFTRFPNIKYEKEGLNKSTMTGHYCDIVEFTEDDTGEVWYGLYIGSSHRGFDHLLGGEGFWARIRDYQTNHPLTLPQLLAKGGSQPHERIFHKDAYEGWTLKEERIMIVGRERHEWSAELLVDGSGVGVGAVYALWEEQRKSGTRYDRDSLAVLLKQQCEGLHVLLETAIAIVGYVIPDGTLSASLQDCLSEKGIETCVDMAKEEEIPDGVIRSGNGHPPILDPSKNVEKSRVKGIWKSLGEINLQESLGAFIKIDSTRRKRSFKNSAAHLASVHWSSIPSAISATAKSSISKLNKSGLMRGDCVKFVVVKGKAVFFDSDVDEYGDEFETLLREEIERVAAASADKSFTTAALVASIQDPVSLYIPIPPNARFTRADSNTTNTAKIAAAAAKEGKLEDLAFVEMRLKETDEWGAARLDGRGLEVILRTYVGGKAVHRYAVGDSSEDGRWIAPLIAFSRVTYLLWRSWNSNHGSLIKLLPVQKHPLLNEEIPPPLPVFIDLDASQQAGDVDVGGEAVLGMMLPAAAAIDGPKEEEPAPRKKKRKDSMLTKAQSLGGAARGSATATTARKEESELATIDEEEVEPMQVDEEEQHADQSEPVDVPSMSELMIHAIPSTIYERRIVTENSRSGDTPGSYYHVSFLGKSDKHDRWIHEDDYGLRRTTAYALYFCSSIDKASMKPPTGLLGVSHKDRLIRAATIRKRLDESRGGLESEGSQSTVVEGAVDWRDNHRLWLAESYIFKREMQQRLPNPPPPPPQPKPPRPTPTQPSPLQQLHQSQKLEMKRSALGTAIKSAPSDVYPMAEARRIRGRGFTVYRDPKTKAVVSVREELTESVTFR